jgi:beta-aspartyl-peptidase (threonine type)
MSVVPVVLVHGGAGPMRRLTGEDERAYRAGLVAAAAAGLEALLRGSALDAVEAAVRSMEASGAFNAGAGACLDEDGRATLDAAVMRGEDLAAGAVGAAQATVHAVTLARAVLEEGRHVLYVGEGADRKARALGLPPQPAVDAGRKKTFERLRAERDASEAEGLRGVTAAFGSDVPRAEESFDGSPRRSAGLAQDERGEARDTVGAVAVDAKGRVAAAVSTGGLWLKAPFRVGDSAVPGAGIYASDESGAAASATGIGERILKLALTKHAVDRVARGSPAAEAARDAIETATRRFGADSAGVIVVDRAGRIGASFDTRGMGRAFARADGASRVAVWRDEPFLEMAP